MPPSVSTDTRNDVMRWFPPLTLLVALALFNAWVLLDGEWELTSMRLGDYVDILLPLLGLAIALTGIYTIWQRMNSNAQLVTRGLLLCEDLKTAGRQFEAGIDAQLLPPLEEEDADARGLPRPGSEDWKLLLDEYISKMNERAEAISDLLHEADELGASLVAANLSATAIELRRTQHQLTETLHKAVTRQ